MSGNSLIFTAASSQYLSATGKTGINQQKFTFATWFLRASTGTNQLIYWFGSNGNNFVSVSINSSGNIVFAATVASTSVASVTTSASYTDTTNWHHIVVAVDTTQATAANRIIIYVDGSVAALSSPTYPAQNTNLSNNYASAYYIGRINLNLLNNFNGNLAQTYYIDGQQLTPSSFISGTPGIPITYTGSYAGTFDFFLPYGNDTSTTTLGYDSSGEGNNWTLNSMTTANQSSAYPASTVALAAAALLALRAAAGPTVAGSAALTARAVLAAAARGSPRGSAPLAGKLGLAAIGRASATNTAPLFGASLVGATAAGSVRQALTARAVLQIQAKAGQLVHGVHLTGASLLAVYGFGTIPPPPPPPGAGKRRNFPSYIPQPPYDVEPRGPIKPIWDRKPEAEPPREGPPAAPRGAPALPPLAAFEVGTGIAPLSTASLPSFDQYTLPNGPDIARHLETVLRQSRNDDDERTLMLLLDDGDNA
jgi:hypothetical protein